MSDYSAVSKALESGADPSMICRTCPWTRACITPPEMTAADVKAHLAEVSKPQPDQDRKDAAVGQLVGTLMGAMIFGGADTKAQVCPVFATRLRESSGRVIVDGIREQMVGWVEVTP